MELTYRKKYSCRESSAKSGYSESIAAACPTVVFQVWKAALTLFWSQVPNGHFRSRFPSLLTAPLARKRRWSNVGRRSGRHRGSHDERKWGICGEKTRFRNPSGREPGGWPGPTLDLNKVWRLGASAVI